MGRVVSVVYSVGGGVGDKNIEAAMEQKPGKQFSDSPEHFLLGILVGAVPVTHRAAQSQNTEALMTENRILNADTAFRRRLLIAVIVVAMDIKHRHLGEGSKKGEILRI